MMNQQQRNPVSIVYYSRTFKGGEWPRDYYPIALVRAVDLEEIFRLTTHSDHLSEDDLAMVSWLQPTRSMMIGDVVENDSGFFRCESFLCEPSGWQRV